MDGSSIHVHHKINELRIKQGNRKDFEGNIYALEKRLSNAGRAPRGSYDFSRGSPMNLEIF